MPAETADTSTVEAVDPGPKPPPLALPTPPPEPDPIPPPEPAPEPEYTPLASLAEAPAMTVGEGAATTALCKVYASTRAIAISAFAAPLDCAMARLCDAMDVPRIGAQPPEIFQLPSLSWAFSIFATHFCKSWRTRALALASDIVPSNSASNLEVTNVSM